MYRPPDPSGPTAGPGAACVRHPDRPTGLTCTRCGRPACTDCLREASVGHQCVDCVAEGSRGTRRARTFAGGRADTSRRPLVTAALIAVNVAFFLVTVLQARNVMNVTDGSFFATGALVPGLVAQGEWWRLVLSGFLHFGLLHIALNMIALWMLGRELEPALGRSRFLAVYLLSVLGCSTAAMLFYSPGSVLIGASGGVFGLMGALVVMLVRLKMPLSTIVPTIVLNAVISIAVPGVSLVGHVGGFLAGAAATALLVYTAGRGRTAVQIAGLVGIGIVLLALCTAASLA